MEPVIFTLTYEKKWDCWVVYASHATDNGDFFLITGRCSEEEAEVSPVVKNIIQTIRKYEGPGLFRQFGRKRYKDEREFLLKVEEQYIREDIRPYIEKYTAQVLDELAEAGLPLFQRGSRLENFYKTERIFVQERFLRAVLRFERDSDHTRYVLRLTDGERVFVPADYKLTILTRKPCRILMGRQLFRFPEDFDGQRLTPFREKREVMIPKANETEYFRKFILKNVRNEEIEVQGFEVIVQNVERRAVLSLEKDVLDCPVFSLEFYYGSQRIPASSSRKALVELRTEGDKYAFYKVNREPEWESGIMDGLLAAGLVLHSPGCFEVGGKDVRMDGELMAGDERRGNWQQAVDWIREHRKKLEELNLGIVQRIPQRNYYLGNWQVDYFVQETVDWFELKAEVILADGRRIPLIRFREAILAGQREFLLEDGSVFLIPEEWFAAYSEILLFAQGRGTSLFLHKNQYALLEGRLKPAEKSVLSGQDVALPHDLRAELRPYQKMGYEWIYRLYQAGLGGCLADDMGLGKTLQMIAVLLKYRQESGKSAGISRVAEPGVQLSLFDEAGSTEGVDEKQAEYRTGLIVVPASLVHNWRNELKKFAPQLSVTVYAGHNRRELRPFLQRSDVVIVTYHTLRNDIDYLARLSFGFVVADEAQALKNPESQIHQSLLRIRGKWFWALSGTPVENSLIDLWSILHFTNRELLGTYTFFKNHFVKPIIADIEGRASDALRKLIAPYILRRTKEEVLNDLPDLTTELVVCEPEEEQQKLYEEEQSRVRNYILGKRERQEGLRNDFMVLKALIRLRQIANHPRLVEPGFTGDSGKFREVFNMLEEVVGAGHKVLVFSSFVKYLMMVAEEVERQGWQYAVLTGATTDREQEIRRFTVSPGCKLFLISLKAGGVGLNLTEADYVFILDPWWNLAAENQAVSRAHRMGQKRAVFVYRFITAGTLEEKILAIQERKQRLSDAVITSQTPVPLNDAEILEALE